MNYKPKLCEKCQVLIVPTCSRQKYCPACSVTRRRERERERWKDPAYREHIREYKREHQREYQREHMKDSAYRERYCEQKRGYHRGIVSARNERCLRDISESLTESVWCFPSIYTGEFSKCS